MIIRVYREVDLEAVSALFTASVHALTAAHYDPLQRAAWAPQPPDLAVWRQRLESLQILVAEQRGAIAGFIAYELNGHIGLLYTAPDHARCGVATELYQRVETRLTAVRVDHFWTEASLVARPFFERQGFYVTEKQRVYRRGVAFQRYRMEKQVALHGDKAR